VKKRIFLTAFYIFYVLSGKPEIALGQGFARRSSPCGDALHAPF
jgi:hypothetical protein